MVPDAVEGAGRRRRVDAEVSVETLAGVGPKVAERLAKLGIRTVRDLAEHAPRTYLDWDEVGSFGDLSAGEEGTVRCTLERIRVRPTRRRNLKLVEGVVVDTAGFHAEVPMNDLIEVGVYASSEGDTQEKPLYLRTHRIRAGDQEIVVTVPGRPGRGGLDPRHLLIDVEPNDNTRSVSRGQTIRFR